MIYSPDTHLRTAYLAALQTATGLPVFADLVPKSTDVPTAYILITSQTKTRTAVAKPTGEIYDNYDWLASIVFDIQFFSPAGFANPGAVEAIEEQIINVAENIVVADWVIKSRVQIQSRPLPVTTATNYINRRVLTYQHWLQKL